MISYELAEKILDYAVTHGGDYAEIFEEEKTYSKITLTNQESPTILTGQEEGTGIRILRGTQSRYIAVSHTDEAEIFKMMKTALKDWADGKEHMERSVLKQPEIFQTQGAKNTVTAEKIRLLRECVQSGKHAASHIVRMQTSCVEDCQTVRLINTEGCNTQDERRKMRLYIKATARDGKESAESYTGPGIMGGMELFGQIDFRKTAEKTARSAQALLHAKPCPTGRMPVIIANGFGGLLFHEACGHSLEASSMADKGSEFSGKIGTQIASEKVTLVDDGTVPGGWGSLHIDDEGIPTRRNVLIEKGILKGCLVDRLDGRRLGMPPTGSARRENYRYAPVARMTNTFLLPGEDAADEMIHSVTRGLYVKNIHAGSVNPVTGEFNFYTNETFLIENGRIVCPVHNATLIGTGREILRKVEMVGTDPAMGQGFCYAGSGAVYIGAGQPIVKIAEMTVGGDEV